MFLQHSQGKCTPEVSDGAKTYHDRASSNSDICVGLFSTATRIYFGTRFTSEQSECLTTAYVAINLVGLVVGGLLLCAAYVVAKSASSDDLEERLLPAGSRTATATV